MPPFNGPITLSDGTVLHFVEGLCVGCEYVVKVPEVTVNPGQYTVKNKSDWSAVQVKSECPALDWLANETHRRLRQPTDEPDTPHEVRESSD